MIDFLIFYLVVGAIINWAIALYALLFGDEEDEVEVNMTHLLITIPVWPLALWQIISSFNEKDENDDK